MTSYQRFFSRASTLMQGSAIRKMGTLGVRVPDVVSFAPGYPAPESFPWDDFRSIVDALLVEREPSTLQYGPTRGFRPLLEAIAEVLAGRGIRIASDDLLVTTGSQQGLDLVARVLVDPGDVVLVELPTYTGAISAFRNAQAELVGVRQDADGIALDHLDAVVSRLRAEGRRVKGLYVVPNFQNPTGLVMSLEKRRRLLDAAGRLDLLLIEDDPYGDLYFDDLSAADTRPIKADDVDGRVVYLSSFSKTLAPGFRVAWIAGPGEILAKLETAKQASDICTGALDQRVAWQAIRRGVLAAQGPRLRALYRHRRDVMEGALRRELGTLASWTEPRGGFFIWAALPESMSAERLLERATTHRVLYVVGSAFFVNGGGQHLLRLSYSQPTPDRLEEGVRRLAAAVREELDERGQGVAAGGGASNGTDAPIA